MLPLLSGTCSWPSASVLVEAVGQNLTCDLFMLLGCHSARKLVPKASGQGRDAWHFSSLASDAAWLHFHSLLVLKKVTKVHPGSREEDIDSSSQ